jgi:hypothetical protein
MYEIFLFCQMFFLDRTFNSIRIFIVMEKKVCSTCDQEKLISEFYIQKGRKNGSSKCRQCFNKYCITRWRQRKKDAIIYKGSSCIDCNLSFPQTPYSVFDFHHLDPSEKDVDWTKLRLRSWSSIMSELDKCVLLCANCHRIRHQHE